MHTHTQRDMYGRNLFSIEKQVESGNFLSHFEKNCPAGQTSRTLVQLIQRPLIN